MNSETGEIDFCFGSSRIDRLDIAGIVRDASPDAHLYCCGPARMIDAFIAACASRAQHTVHFERFAASSEAATDGGYDVVLNRSGERLTVAPGKTILDTLLDHSIDVPYACTAGAHIDLHLPQDMVRSYSLVNAPWDTGRYVIAVQRDSEGRSVSTATTCYCCGSCSQPSS